MKKILLTALLLGIAATPVLAAEVSTTVTTSGTTASGDYTVPGTQTASKADAVEAAQDQRQRERRANGNVYAHPTSNEARENANDQRHRLRKESASENGSLND